MGTLSTASPSGRPDAELACAARRGEREAFVEIVARHQALVCGVAYGILNDLAASEDAAQEAFVTAWRKMAELRAPHRLRPWLGDGREEHRAGEAAGPPRQRVSRSRRRRARPFTLA